MKRITVTFTTAELALLRSLATDQLFRREFIDPRLPGYRSNAAELALGKQLVERLRLLTDATMETAPTGRNGTARLKVRSED
jgi:hypothetical protein